MKAIHTAQTNQPKLNPFKKENASVSSRPVPVVSSARSHPSFALRCANKLKEFFGLFSIILPQTQRGGTSKYISRLRKLRIVGSFASIMLVFISTGIIIPYYIKTNNSEATAGQAIGSTLTFSAESLTASVSLSNLDKDGTFATSGNDEQAEFSIATDNFTGYTLTMRSTSGNTLSGSEGNTDTFTSIQSNISASTFSNSANTTYNNQWGIIPNYYYSNNATIANTDTYLKVPAANESITLDVTSAKNTEAKNYTIGIGARADYTNKIDTYSNTFILEYIANPVTYSITYNANAGSDTVTNMPTTNPQTGSTSGGTVNSVNLTSNIPTRTGYTFKGWCSVSTSDDTCSGTIYNDQTVEAANRIMNYGIDQTIDNTMVTLNAMWTRNNATYSLTLDANGGTNAPTVNNIINNTGSATFTLPTTIPTYDGYNFLGWCSTATSDNTCSGTTYSYDESTTSFNPSTITLTQSDLSSSTVGATLYAIWEVGLPDIDDIAAMQDFASLTAEEYTAVLSSMTEGQSYQLADGRDNNTYNVAKLADGNVWLLDNLRLGASTLTTNLTSANTNVSTSTTIEANTFNGWNTSSGFSSYTAPMFNASEANSPTSDPWKYGVYYNYCVASAGSYCYAYNTSTGNASQDICPAGWRMPAGDTGAYSYYALYTAYSSNVANFKNALRTPLSGGFFSNTATGKGSNGSFWSSTYHNGGGMRALRVDGSSVDPQDFDGRNGGSSVRCVLKSFMDQHVSTMQDFASLSADDKAAVVSSMTEGTAYNFTDNRDGNTYAVAKLADGNVWILDNLRADIVNISLATLKGNTNATDEELTYLKNGGGTTSDKWPTAALKAWPSGTSNNYSYSVPYTNSTTKDSATTGYGSGSKTRGVYYNYCAASAGTYCYGNGYSFYGTPPANSSPSGDICPKGWSMPTGGASGQYQGLCDAIKGSSCGSSWSVLLSSSSGLGYNLSTPLSGRYYNGSFSYVGSSGYGNFWSSTYSNANNMHYLNVNSSSVNPQNSGNRYVGLPVRCVLK